MPEAGPLLLLPFEGTWLRDTAEVKIADNFVPIVGQAMLTLVPSHHRGHGAAVTLPHTHFHSRPPTIALASLYQTRLPRTTTLAQQARKAEAA